MAPWHGSDLVLLLLHRLASAAASSPCRPSLQRVLKGGASPNLGCRGAAVSLRWTCGRDRRSGAGHAAELRRRIHDDGGKAVRSRPTCPASPTSSVRKHVLKELTSAQTT